MTDQPNEIRLRRGSCSKLQQTRASRLVVGDDEGSVLPCKNVSELERQLRDRRSCNTLQDT